jgi:hypothetical protein
VVVVVAVSFVVPIYKDQRFAARLIQQIRAYYPISPLLVIADGIHDPNFAAFVQHHNGHYHLGDRLKLKHLGCVWSIRMLELMQQHMRGDIWIKLDADAMLYRPIDFSALTQPFDLAGDIRVAAEGWAYTRGGCRYYHPPVVKRILESRLLLDPKYAWALRWGYLRYSKRYKLPGDPPGEILESLHSEDSCLGDAGAQLGLKLVEAPDICIKFREPVPSEAHLNYSVVHPVR